MTSWAELLKNRRPMVSVSNSAHLLECVKEVRGKYPAAVIQEVTPGSWRLMLDVQALSNEHNSHYACWAEAREVMNESDQ